MECCLKDMLWNTSLFHARCLLCATGKYLEGRNWEKILFLKNHDICNHQNCFEVCFLFVDSGSSLDGKTESGDMSNYLERIRVLRAKCGFENNPEDATSGGSKHTVKTGSGPSFADSNKEVGSHWLESSQRKNIVFNHLFSGCLVCCRELYQLL